LDRDNFAAGRLSAIGNAAAVDFEQWNLGARAILPPLANAPDSLKR
jgi:hypothetical protein